MPEPHGSVPRNQQWQTRRPARITQSKMEGQRSLCALSVKTVSASRAFGGTSPCLSAGTGREQRSCETVRHYFSPLRQCCLASQSRPCPSGNVGERALSFPLALSPWLSLSLSPSRSLTHSVAHSLQAEGRREGGRVGEGTVFGALRAE